METFRIVYRDGFEIDIDADYFATSPLYVRFFSVVRGFLGWRTDYTLAQFELAGIRGVTKVRHIRDRPEREPSIISKALDRLKVEEQAKI